MRRLKAEKLRTVVDKILNDLAHNFRIGPIQIQIHF